MSTAFAAAAITAILKSRVENWIAQRSIISVLGADVVVSALPPDRIPTGADERPQINLFLYALLPNTAIHRGDATARRGGLTFDAQYLVTAYGASDLQGEALLGCAIQALQQSTALDRDTFQPLVEALATSGLGLLAAASDALGLALPDRLTITPQLLSVEDSTRIWSALQARYRPSVAYRVSAVTLGGEEGR